VLLYVVKGILLDIGLNLRYSLGLLSHTSNFPYTLIKICLLCEIIFVEEFYTFTKQGTKNALFCFLLLIQHSAFQKKTNKVTLPHTKTFFQCKTPVVCAIDVFIASQ